MEGDKISPLGFQAAAKGKEVLEAGKFRMKSGTFGRENSF
jgi:hypothetical protein